jgi:hypothetical protein
MEKIILKKVAVGKLANEIKAEHYVVNNLIPQIKVFAALMDEDSRKVAWKHDMEIVECKFGTNLKNRWDLVEMIQEAYTKEIEPDLKPLAESVQKDYEKEISKLNN